MIGRRQFTVATGAVLAATMASRAQAQKKLPVVGVVTAAHRSTPEDRAKHPFVAGLRELGWEDGKTFRYEPAYGEGRVDRLPELAAALVAKKVDVIVTFGSEGTRAARQATDTIAIVAVGPNPVALGFASSLARPGGNVTGLTLDVGVAILGKRVELLKRAVPAAKRIAYIRSRPLPGQAPLAAETVEVARALGVVLSVVAAGNPEDLDAAFVDLSRNRPDAIWLADTQLNISNRDRIIAFAARERLPAIYGQPVFAKSGGLMSYGVNTAELDRRAAQYVDKILKGAKPGDLAIEQPTRFELVINLKTAAALGITIPQALLLSADEVIR